LIHRSIDNEVNMKRVGIILAVLVIGLSVALFFRLRELKARTEGPAGGTGTIEGTDVHITSRIPARIKAIHVNEGDQVRTGQVLVELDCIDPTAQLNQAQAQLAAAEASAQAAHAVADASAAGANAARQAAEAAAAHKQTLQTGKTVAERELARLTALKDAGAVTSVSLDRGRDQVVTLSEQLQGVSANEQAARAQATAAQKNTLAARAQIQSAESAIVAARAMVTRAEVMVGECQLTAPRDGVVSERYFEPGEAVLPGTNILTVVDTREAKVTFFLPNAELASAAPGRAVTVQADAYPDERFAGRIQRVASEAEFTPKNIQTREDRDRLVFGVEVRIPNPDGKLRPGMPVEVTIDGTGK
jgi:HlyD family secretion protein